MSAEEHFSTAVIAKAKKIESEHVERSEGDPTVFLVKSPRTGKKVRVQFLFDSEDPARVEWRTCTCTNGNKRGGQASCYHAAAAELQMEASGR